MPTRSTRARCCGSPPSQADTRQRRTAPLPRGVRQSGRPGDPQLHRQQRRLTCRPRSGSTSPARSPGRSASPGADVDQPSKAETPGGEACCSSRPEFADLARSATAQARGRRVPGPGPAGFRAAAAPPSRRARLRAARWSRRLPRRTCAADRRHQLRHRASSGATSGGCGERVVRLPRRGSCAGRRPTARVMIALRMIVAAILGTTTLSIHGGRQPASMLCSGHRPGGGRYDGSPG